MSRTGMQAVSSVIAFLARYGAEPAADPEGQEILATLDSTERLVAEELARTPRSEDRVRLFTERTGEPCEPARYERIETRALGRLHHELARRGWLRS